MKKQWRVTVLLGIIGLVILTIVLGIYSTRNVEEAKPELSKSEVSETIQVENKDVLENCTYSKYDVETHYSGQYYVVASYPVLVQERIVDLETDCMVTDYVVEKKDGDGKYRTVYDTAHHILPVEQEIVTKNPYDHYSAYKELDLQPIVDMYGDGEYRVISMGKGKKNAKPYFIPHEYFVVSGEHLERKDTFGETFQIEEADLQNLHINNNGTIYDMTREEQKQFIDFILNMECVALNEQKYRDVFRCISNSPVAGAYYLIALNMEGHESCYIYHMTGKDLDGNTYQAVFRSGDTLVCLDSEENLLIMLDALKQKHNQRVQANK